MILVFKDFLELGSLFFFLYQLRKDKFIDNTNNVLTWLVTSVFLLVYCYKFYFISQL